MDNRGLIFIPDISGFTRFVTEMEIDHSRLIIQELLELLINVNQLGLLVSEVEGDAILFYKFGERPELTQIYKQVEKMFREFHTRLIGYDYRRFCQCKACSTAIDLSLKVITHYGEFTGYRVKNFSKLIGKDIIVAHQLLKNDIAQHEYWLVTENLLDDSTPAKLTPWINWQQSVKQTETGEVPFQYAQLGELKNEIVPESLPQIALQNKIKMISVSQEYPADIIKAFHAIGDFNYRSRWQEGVTKVEEVTHILPRVGMRCRTVMENGDANIYITSYSYHPERIEFSETDEKTKNTTYYLLEKIADVKTRLTIDLYIKKDVIAPAIFRMTRKKKLETTFQKSLQNLEEFLKTEEPI